MRYNPNYRGQIFYDSANSIGIDEVIPLLMQELKTRESLSVCHGSYLDLHKKPCIFDCHHVDRCLLCSRNHVHNCDGYTEHNP